MNGNLFIPTGAWRKMQKLSRYVVAAINAAECMEEYFDKKRFEPDNFDFSVRELQRASAALARYYFARNTKASMTRAKKLRKQRKENREHAAMIALIDNEEDP